MLAALTSAEYRASIYKPSGGEAPPPMRIGSTIVEDAAAQPGGHEAVITGSDMAPEGPRTPALRDTTSPSKRKVRPIFLLRAQKMSTIRLVGPVIVVCS